MSEEEVKNQHLSQETDQVEISENHASAEHLSQHEDSITESRPSVEQDLNTTTDSADETPKSTPEEKNGSETQQNDESGKEEENKNESEKNESVQDQKDGPQKDKSGSERKDEASSQKSDNANISNNDEGEQLIQDAGVNPNDVAVDVNDANSQQQESFDQDGLHTTEEGLQRTKPVRHPTAQDKLTETMFDGVYTVDQSFRERAKLQPDIPCMGHRKFIEMHKEDKAISGVRKVWEIPEFSDLEWVTYGEVDEVMSNVCSGIINFTGCEKGKVLGIYLDTCPEWLQYAHGCWRAGLIMATCYANLGVDALKYCIQQCDIKCMLIDGSTIETFEELKSECPTLSHLIYVGELKKETDQFSVKSFRDIVKDGSANPVEPREHSGDDLCTIMYTSGSTGVPKGVEVPHRSLNACSSAIASGLVVGKNDVYLGYLPLAHILELAAETAMYVRGARVGYGNPKTLVDDKAKPMGDIRAVNPTVMASVPRVQDTIKKGLLYKVNQGGALKKFLFKRALKAKLKTIRKGKGSNPIWDALVFKKLRAKVGLSRIRVLVSGGAPLNPTTQEFIHAILGCDVLQGYGLTETGGGGTVQTPGSLRLGEVGPPIPSCEICLEDVPDMNYYAKDNVGQILIRGHNVNRGYYKEPEKTKEVFTEDGWFKTGDVGSFTDDGCLKITDRIKNLIKMSHGEYVSLEPLEAMYGANNRFVAPNGMCIYGNANSRHIVGLVNPNQPEIVEWAKKQHIDYKDMDELLAKNELKRAVLDEFDRIAREHKRQAFEFVRDVYLCPVEWTPENGMLTSAMKLQRNNIYKEHQVELDAMYARLGDE